MLKARYIVSAITIWSGKQLDPYAYDSRPYYKKLASRAEVIMGLVNMYGLPRRLTLSERTIKLSDFMSDGFITYILSILIWFLKIRIELCRIF
jgi:hypothetical protein